MVKEGGKGGMSRMILMTMYKCLNLQPVHAFRREALAVKICSNMKQGLPTCSYCDVAYVIYICEASMRALTRTKWF